MYCACEGIIRCGTAQQEESLYLLGVVSVEESDG